MAAYAYKVGDFVLTPEGDCDGVIIAFKGRDDDMKALVCENYFAEIMIRNFGATVRDMREQCRCKSFYCRDLMPDDDDE